MYFILYSQTTTEDYLSFVSGMFHLRNLMYVRTANYLNVRYIIEWYLLCMF